MKDSRNELLDAVRNSMFDGDYPVICNLHDLGSDQNSHNCLGCNFAELVEAIEHIASDIPKFSDEKTGKITFILWLYLLTERMQEILRLVSFPEEMKIQKFSYFSLVKKWGNFFKHPKAFFLTHHAEYDRDRGEDDVLIDDDFINKYYGGDKHNQQLYALLTNKKNVVVKLPNLMELTAGLGCELAYLSKVIRSNPIYSEILTNKSVLEDYYSAVTDNT